MPAHTPQLKLQNAGLEALDGVIPELTQMIQMNGKFLRRDLANESHT